MADATNNGLTLDEALVHFGVKGMRWGVRKNNQLDRRITRAKKVASGKANFREKATFVTTDTSQAALAKNRGVKGAARSRAAQLEARKARIDSGKNSVLDVLKDFGNDVIIPI